MTAAGRVDRQSNDDSQHDGSQHDDSPRSASLPRRVAASVGFVALVAAVQLLRQPGVPTWNTLWAEDGARYTTDALSMSAWHAIRTPYAGYVQLLPRLLSLPVRVLPATWYAPWFAWTGAITAGLLGLLVVHSADGWITNRGLRWLLGFSLTAAPSLAYELNANVVNLNWLLAAASFWVVASRRRGAAETGLRAVVLVIAALSTPVVAATVPFAVFVAAVRRTRDDVVVLASLLGGLGLQVLLSRNASHAPVSGHDYGQASRVFGARVVGSLVLGERWLSDLVPARTGAVIVGSLLVLGVIVVAARIDLLRGDRLWLVAGAVVTAFGSYASAVIGRGTNWLPLVQANGAYSPAGSRYLYGPIFLLLSAVIVVVDSSRADWLKAVVAAWVLAATISSLGLGGFRSMGPAWSTTVRAAQAGCRQHPDQSTYLVVITPFTWRAEIPCSRLR